MDLLRLKLSRGHRLPHQPITVSAAKGLVIFLDWSFAAVRALRINGGVFSLDGFAAEIAHFFNDVARQIADVSHEMLAIQFAMRHLFQTRFPFPGHFRSNENFSV